MRYYLSHIGGLEEIVAAEVAQRLPAASLFDSDYGHLQLAYAGPPQDLLALRTVEHVCVQVADLSPVRPEVGWLDELTARVAELDLTPALEHLRTLRPVPACPRFRATAQRQGQHEYRSPDIAGAAGAGVVDRYGWPVDLTDYELDIRVDIREDRGLLGLRLSEAALHRRSRVVHCRASLNPTVAAAMVLLSEPCRGEVVADPMCGAGTLLVEREGYEPGARLLGGDLFAEKLALTAQNLQAFAVPASLVQADAARLPLASGSLDKVLCNLPWGRIVASPQINRRLYPRFLRELARCLRPGGLAVLLTSERSLMARCLQPELPLRTVTAQLLSVGGLKPTLYQLRRL